MLGGERWWATTSGGSPAARPLSLCVWVAFFGLNRRFSLSLASLHAGWLWMPYRVGRGPLGEVAWTVPIDGATDSSD